MARKGNITGETNLPSALGRRQTRIGARRPCTVLGAGAMATEGPGTEVPANLGRSKTPQSSTCSPPPSHAPWDPTPSPAYAFIL